MLIGYKLLNYYFGTIHDCIRRRLFSYIYLIFEVSVPVLWLRGFLRSNPGTREEAPDAKCYCALSLGALLPDCSRGGEGGCSW